VRFAFAVEWAETAGAIVPQRLSLAGYAQTKKDGAGEPPPPPFAAAKLMDRAACHFQRGYIGARSAG
jgi:hypothetical protein